MQKQFREKGSDFSSQIQVTGHHGGEVKVQTKLETSSHNHSQENRGKMHACLAQLASPTDTVQDLPLRECCHPCGAGLLT